MIDLPSQETGVPAAGPSGTRLDRGYAAARVFTSVAIKITG